MKKLIDWIKFAFNFVRYDIWRITGNELSKTRRISYNIIKTIYLSVRGITSHKLGIRAAALTFSISFAIVPLIALISAIAKGFGIETTIEVALQDTFAAQADLIPTIMEFVRKYLDSMSGGLFIGIGFGIRYDFGFVVARFDFGFKTYNPAKDSADRWFKEYNFSNSVFNVGINYPF